jgi:hypothetical protein
LKEGIAVLKANKQLSAKELKIGFTYILNTEMASERLASVHLGIWRSLQPDVKSRGIKSNTFANLGSVFCLLKEKIDSKQECFTRMRFITINDIRTYKAIKSDDQVAIEAWWESLVDRLEKITKDKLGLVASSSEAEQPPVPESAKPKLTSPLPVSLEKVRGRKITRVIEEVESKFGLESGSLRNLSKDASKLSLPESLGDTQSVAKVLGKSYNEGADSATPKVATSEIIMQKVEEKLEGEKNYNPFNFEDVPGPDGFEKKADDNFPSDEEQCRIAIANDIATRLHPEVSPASVDMAALSLFDKETIETLKVVEPSGDDKPDLTVKINGKKVVSVGHEYEKDTKGGNGYQLSVKKDGNSIAEKAAEYDALDTILKLKKINEKIDNLLKKKADVEKEANSDDKDKKLNKINTDLCNTYNVRNFVMRYKALAFISNCFRLRTKCEFDPLKAFAKKYCECFGVKVRVGVEPSITEMINGVVKKVRDAGEVSAEDLTKSKIAEDTINNNKSTLWSKLDSGNNLEKAEKEISQVMDKKNNDNGNKFTFESLMNYEEEEEEPAMGDFFGDLETIIEAADKISANSPSPSSDRTRRH